MFKYTLDPNIRRRLFHEQTPGKNWWDPQYRNQRQFISDIGSNVRDSFRIIPQIKKFSFYYSEKELQYVPVGGWLIPVKYFEVEIV